MKSGLYRLEEHVDLPFHRNEEWKYEWGAVAWWVALLEHLIANMETEKS